MRILTAATFTLVTVLTTSPLGAQATPTTAANAARTQVQDFVRKYVEVSNSADVTAGLEFISRRPEVSNAAMGEITRGFEAIRKEADEMVGMEGRYKIAIGSMDVTMLGTSYALVVAPTSVTIVDERGQAVQVRGAASLVLEKVSGAWKVLHEHYSLKVE